MTAVLSLAGRRLGHLTVEYYAPGLYQGLGARDPGYVLLVTDLPRRSQVRPPATPVSGDVRADRIARDVVARIEAANRVESGLLCDETASGSEQLEMVTAGTCFVWCTGRTRILRDALTSAGLRARIVTLAGTERTLPSGVVVQSSEAHATVEYDAGDGWVWVDPTYGVTASLGGRRAGLADVLEAVASGNPAFIALGADVEMGDALERYLTPDKRLLVNP